MRRALDALCRAVPALMVGVLACGGEVAAVPTLSASPQAQAAAQAGWEAVHEASDAMAPSYLAAGGHTRVAALPDARDACWRAALGAPQGALVAGADSNVTFDLAFAAACQLGGRTLAGGQTVSAFVHVSPPAREVDLVGDWTLTLAGGGRWRTTALAGAPQQRAAVLTNLADGDLGHGHFGVVLRAARQLTDAAGATTSLTVTSAGAGAAAAVTVAETTDPTGLRLAARRVLERGVVTVVDSTHAFTAAHTFTGLATDFTGGCMCPGSGTLVQDLTFADGSLTTHRYSFSGCGQATVVSTAHGAEGFQSSVSQVFWPACT